MAGADAGERVSCPSCGETVLRKAMIPVLGEGGQGIRYLCVACARTFVVHGAGADASGTETDEGAAGRGGRGAGRPAATGVAGTAAAEPAPA